MDTTFLYSVQIFSHITLSIILIHSEKSNMPDVTTHSQKIKPFSFFLKFTTWNHDTMLTSFAFDTYIRPHTNNFPFISTAWVLFFISTISFKPNFFASILLTSPLIFAIEHHFWIGHWYIIFFKEFRNIATNDTCYSILLLW